MRDLRPTKRQQQVLSMIARHQSLHGYPPTVRELAAALGIRSISGVGEHLRRMAAKRLLTWEPGKSRTLRVIGGL